MVVFPNCKLNLGLWVTERLPDGYHLIESVFYPLPFTDLLEVIIAKDGKTELSVSGIPLQGNPWDNICLKAWKLMDKVYDIGPVKIVLHKQIPAGAGLGGGSADGAFTIRLLNELFQLKLDIEIQKQLAFRLGMDCPFFIENRASYATGKGEKLAPINLQLDGLFLALVKPPIHVSTSEAYAEIKPQRRDIPLSEVIRLPVSAWRDKLVNDFEFPVFQKYPEIGHIKQQLYQKGAIYASMSGSGSGVFGLFSEKPSLEPDFGDWYCKVDML